MVNKATLKETFINWFPLAIVIVIFSGLVYGAVQQSYRQAANDPQIQIAQDLVTAIGQGQPVDQIVPPQGTTELSNTLSPFVLIYSASSTIIGSSAVLDGKVPSFPASVLERVKMHGEQRLTWQPRQGVREAVVVTQFTSKQPGFESGYIVAGRSLKEVEVREKQLCLMTALAGVISLVLTFLALLYFIVMSKRRGMSGMPSGTEEVSMELKITETKNS